MSEACSKSYSSAAKIFSKGKVCVTVSQQWGPGAGNNHTQRHSFVLHE